MFIYSIFSGYIIPKGWKVLTWARAIHMDPAYYSNPDEFNPSRWNVSCILFSFD
jgi:cytochrome P450